VIKNGSIFLYDHKNGRRWEYFKTSEKYMCEYSEFHQSIGWKKLSNATHIDQEDYMHALALHVHKIPII
jgi:hypothetical protein